MTPRPTRGIVVGNQFISVGVRRFHDNLELVAQYCVDKMIIEDGVFLKICEVILRHLIVNYYDFDKRSIALPRHYKIKMAAETGYSKTTLSNAMWQIVKKNILTEYFIEKRRYCRIKYLPEKIPETLNNYVTIDVYGTDHKAEQIRKEITRYLIRLAEKKSTQNHKPHAVQRRSPFQRKH